MLTNANFVELSSWMVTFILTLLPWAKEEETVLENLQILYAPHNLAKGNLEYDSNNI